MCHSHVSRLVRGCIIIVLSWNVSFQTTWSTHIFFCLYVFFSNGSSVIRWSFPLYNIYATFYRHQPESRSQTKCDEFFNEVSTVSCSFDKHRYWVDKVFLRFLLQDWLDYIYPKIVGNWNIEAITLLIYHWLFLLSSNGFCCYF